MIIRGLNKTTLLDFPGRVGATVFTGGCNFRCPFCQNSDLVYDPQLQPVIPEEEFFSFLKKRKGILEGICITGGEPALQPDLIPFIKKIKEVGLAVKLDTNGYRPDILEELLKEGLPDMVAMDIKSDREHYSEAAGLKDVDISRIEASVELLLSGRVEYEFRTTVVREYYNDETASAVAEWLKGAQKYFLQCFEDNERVVKRGLTAPSCSELLRYRGILSEKIKQVEIRGIDC